MLSLRWAKHKKGTTMPPSAPSHAQGAMLAVPQYSQWRSMQLTPVHRAPCCD